MRARTGIHATEWVSVKAWQRTRLTQCISQRASYDVDKEACLKEVTIEFRVSGRSDLDARDAANGRSDVPIDVAMEMATTKTSIAAETAGATIFDPLERNHHGKQRTWSEDPAVPSDWRSRMARTIRQHAQEATQLHRTVGHLVNLVEGCAAREEVQRLALLTWMQQREQKWDSCYEDDKLWGAGIKNMIAKTMKGVAQGQEVRESER